MQEALVGFLSGLSSTVFWFAVGALAMINGAAIAAFLVTRSRRLVDEWTPSLLAADVALVGLGLGVPLAAALAKMGVRVVAAIAGGAVPVE